MMRLRKFFSIVFVAAVMTVGIVPAGSVHALEAPTDGFFFSATTSTNGASLRVGRDGAQ